MEPVGVGATYFDEEWESISKMLSSHENDDFMLQLQGDDDNHHECMNAHHHHHYHHDNGVLDIVNGGKFYSSCSSSDVLINSHESNDDDGGVMKMMMNVIENNCHSSGVPTFYQDGAMGPDIGEGNNLQTAIVDSHQEVKQLKRSFGTSIKNISSQNPMKKPRVWRCAQKSKKTALPMSSKKSLENGDEDEEEGNAQNSSCSSSDHHRDELIHASNQLTIIKMQTSNSKEKSRATRGSAATDPQSLYARRRRERINERLRILQNLVPNGTKVDISTMLEEAVHYVKFLQLQIKLLSSDDLWMYAPIAYNGMDISLCQKAMQK